MHVFFTGAKRVGKSTLIAELLSAFPGQPGGFRTVRVDTVLPGRYTVHLLRLDREEVPTKENLLFCCARPGADLAERFETLGCEALSEDHQGDLILMDELGPHEAEAERFQQAVRKALNGRVPVLGVLQQAQTPFLEEISLHPNVCVIPVTLENRDKIRGRIPELLKLLK